jgi:4-hydroxythreonine-4-phosphate dehydrogenase
MRFVDTAQVNAQNLDAPLGAPSDPAASGAAPAQALSAQTLWVTMGDAVGIGPECIVRAFMRGHLADAVVVGCPAVMGRAARAVGAAVPVALIEGFEDLAQVPPGALPVVRPPGLAPDLATLPWGQPAAACGAAAAACVNWAVKRLLGGEGQALVTAPLHKAALSAAGVPFPGHTEMLQAACMQGGQLPPVRMMLANEQLRVVLVTIHQSLRSAIDALSEAAVLQTLLIAHEAVVRWGLPRARIAVAGLNPHAGEDGLFGDEEHRIIAPAIRAAQAQGIDARGPFPPDTVFMRARHAPPAHPGEFDVVVAMTHDHGLIPVKYLGVEEGVNVTLGLPILRTSPDHGTAYDIAGRGLADPRSLEAALSWARRAGAAHGAVRG